MIHDSKKEKQTMHREKAIRSRSLLLIMLGIVGIFLFGHILMQAQSRIVKLHIQEEMEENSTYIRETFSSYKVSGQSISRWTTQNHDEMLRLIVHTIRENPALMESKVFLEEMRTILGTNDLMIVDRRGNVVSSASGLVKDLKDDVYVPLFETFDTSDMTQLSVLSYGQVMKRLSEDNLMDSESTDDVQESLNPIFYALAIDDERACVIDEEGIMQMLYMDVTDAWAQLLDNEVIGSEGFAFVWANGSNEILYFLNYLNKGEDIATLGVDTSLIQSGQFIEANVNGQDMYLYPVYDEEEDVWIACAVPMKELSLNREGTTALIWLVFTILSVSLVVYAILLLRRKEAEPAKNMLHTEDARNNISRKRKLLVFTVFCCITFFLCSLYLQTLYLMSRWADDNTALVSRIEDRLESNQYYYEGLCEYYENGQQIITDLLAWYIEQSPDMATTEALDKLCALVNRSNLTIMDTEGNVTIASSSYAPETSGTHAQTMISVKSLIRGDDSRIIAYVCTEEPYSILESIRMRMDLKGTIKTVQPGEGGFAFAVNSDTRQFSWHPDYSMIGKSALDYGMKESDLRNHLCSFIQLNRDTYYAVSGQKDENLIYVTILKERLLKNLLPLTATEAVAALMILLLIALPLYTLPEPARPKSRRAALSGIIRQKSEERKAFYILSAGAAVIGIWFILSQYVSSNSSRENILHYALSGNWEYGMNLFALTASLILIFKVGLGLLFFRIMAGVLSEILSVRAATGVRMLTSLVSYGGVLFIGYRCLIYFGMDPSTLMASAGIISVVIGIGANSLVGDIIAGVFLLMEGNVQVGDIVSIADFRGRVEDLGIRMTKLYDIDNHVVKIIPNKEVQNVVHMSMRPACLRLEYQITYEEDLERVEALLVRELSSMEGQIPGMIGKPIYKGVRRLDDNGVVLSVDAIIHEENRLVVNRGINRRVYMMFCNNGIEVPFPQLTVHSASEPPAEE